ncbi:MAG: PAS domain S-box protein, partial [Calditrichaeota bacterium]|nr:PAS domain S-box protein [Calditrichota bacterium]
MNKQTAALEKQVRELTRQLEETERKLQEKSDELKRKTFSLGMANVEMLAVQEQLESKNAEMETLLRELSRSKDGLQAIIDTSPAAIVMIDGQDTISAANRQVHAFFGLSRETTLGKSYSDFINAIKPCFEDFAAFTRFSAEMEGMCEQDGSFELHDIYARSVVLLKPHLRSIVAVPALVRDEAGEELGKIWVFNDITQLKRADEVLHTIAEASPIPFIISRLADGRIIYVNEPLAAMVGMTSQEMIGTHTPDFYADLKDRDALLAKLHREGSLRGH